MIGAIALSFTNYSGGPNFRFIGLKNYMVAFTDQNFLSYLLVTFEFMTITVIFQIGLGLGFALLLSRNFKGCSTYRGILYLPNILSSVAVGLAFMFIFEPSSGFMNQLLASLGLPTTIFELDSTATMNSTNAASHLVQGIQFN